jgi:hypothetical protein
MINYYFFQFIKKKNLDRTVDRGPSRGDGFRFFEFGPRWTGPCGTVDRPTVGRIRVFRIWTGPYGTVDRGPYGTVNRPGLNQTDPDRTDFNTLFSIDPPQ